jgi:1,4-alpha-glucan branching enzyme
MLDLEQIDRICEARHEDPFAVLGMHRDDLGRLWVRALLPDASSVTVLDTAVDQPVADLVRRHRAGFFEGTVPGSAPFRYRLRVREGDEVRIIEDPYRFGPVLEPTDLWLLAEGTHQRPFEALGAHPRVIDDVAGTAFAVWAPNAQRVSVTGDFNRWDGRRHPMRLRREAGIWEIFLPQVNVGARYKFELRARADGSVSYKCDPYGRQAELRPANANVVVQLPQAVAASDPRRRANAPDAPISIYEVHTGSWRRRAPTPDPSAAHARGRGEPTDSLSREAGEQRDQGGRNDFLCWDELADTLVPYVADLGFTHVELLPITEHPLDASWGYQPIGLYAPTARHGGPAGLLSFVSRCHQHGLGVILDWVPGHFPADPHGLAQFDGTHLYEHCDPREGQHPDWGTLIYNFGRREVRNFLIGNALYWLERFGVDGLRVDAVASMLYRDYSRPPGHWIPNVHGGRENLEAIEFVRQLNTTIRSQRPEAMMVAEESTAFPGVSRAVADGGLGFHYKWNMGWMHDTLRYIGRDPVHRRFHQNDLTFGLLYAFQENFVLPLSHDEVVHGKGSLFGRMPGDRWQRFANLRTYLAFMWCHPGKKLLFMGGEFAQVNEWNHERSLDWQLLEDPLHAGVRQLVRDLNRLLRCSPALHQRDFEATGFEWIDHSDASGSVVAFLRRGRDPRSLVVAVCNFTPVVREGYRIGVPCEGRYVERVNTDSHYYGGSNVGTALGVAQAQAQPWHGRPYSVTLTLPPLATMIFERAD